MIGYCFFGPVNGWLFLTHMEIQKTTNMTCVSGFILLRGTMRCPIPMALM